MENKPLEEILTGIVMKANPVTTVQSPTEKDQNLFGSLPMTQSKQATRLSY